MRPILYCSYRGRGSQREVCLPALFNDFADVRAGMANGEMSRYLESTDARAAADLGEECDLVELRVSLSESLGERQERWAAERSDAARTALEAPAEEET